MKKFNLNKVPKWMTLMVLLFSLGIGAAWAGGGDVKYYSNLTASNGTGEGMVYASASATTSPEWAATSTASKQEGDYTFKAYAKAKHGYAFNGWTKGNNTVTLPKSMIGNGDEIKVTKSSEGNGENMGTVTANWKTASSVNVTYHKPEGGKYTIQYRYDDWNATSNAFESTTSTSLLTENDANKTIATYSGDVITLTPDNSGGNFAGWYSNDALTTALAGITDNNDGTYTYAVPASASNVYAKFNETKTFYGQLNVQIATVSAENAGTIYASLLNSTESAGWTTSTITLKSSATDADDEYNLLQLPFYLFSQVENITRFAFKGWYSDAACTKLLSADADYTYNLPASSTDKNNPTIQTVYACFGQLVNRYVSVTANVKADQAAQGMVLTSLEEIANPSYTLFAPSSSTVATVATPNSEADATVYLYAQAAYGKKFVGWYDNADCMGAAVSTANPCEYTATAISSDLNNPTVKTLYAKFVDESKVSITYMHPTDGSYSASALHIVDGEWQWEEIYNSGNESADVTRAQYKTNYLTLNANPNAGKGVKSWIDRESGTATITSIEWVRETEIAGARTFGVTFGDSKPFRVESIDYATLADAIAAVNASTASSVTILVTENAYVAAGNYTLPKKAILLVPYKSDQTSMDAQPSVVNGSYNSPTCFRTLTLANGVKLNVLGKIQAGGRMSANAQTDGRNGTPTGDYGKIVLNEGSKVTLENGSYLYAWGYITGKGTIDAQKGSTTYEFLQVTDWRGGSAISALNGNSQKVFPLHQYYIQNIESSITFRPGAVEYCEGTVNASGSSYPFHDVKFVGVDGSGSMFMMDDKDASADTWLRKYYDAANDQQVYEVNSSARIGSLSLSLKGIPFSSTEYVLPITNNMKIHLLTGTMSVTQDTEMFPGAEIEVERGATAYVNENVSLYLFDSDEWPGFGSTAGAQPYFYPLPYTAANGTTVKRDKTKKPKDALLNIHGTFDVNGYLYTTEGGANVFSNNEDAGTVIFRTAPTGTSVIYTYNSTASSGTLFTEIVATWMHSYTVNPVWLKNGAGASEAYTKTYISSSDHAEAGSSYCFINNIWGKWRADGCFMVDDNTGIYYAKPSDYVALKSNTADANHLYHSTDDNLLIVTDGCMWWQVTEVEGIPGLYVWKENPADPNTQKIYYTWDNTNSKWVEKVYTITWKNFDGSTLHTYTNAKYGVIPQYLHGTPTRAQDDYYTYEFSGWTPELIPVTSNSSYTATYTPIERKYKIVFKNGSTTIETVMCGMGITPVCSKEVEGLGVTKEWSPAITAVTGDATYNLVDMPETYTITFVNWNGTQLQQNTGVEPNTPVSYTGTEPTRAQTTDKTFAFNGWKTATTTYAKNAVLPNASQSVTYVAVFAELPREYAITVSANANGSASGGGSFGYGTEHQITASANAGYGFKQWNDGNKDNPRTISVAGAATYTASFAPLTYFVRYDGNGATSGATTYSTHTYNEAKALTANGFVKSGCAFAGWNSAADGSGTNYTNEQSVTNLSSVQDATVTLYAQWTAGTYTVTFEKGAGSGGSNNVIATFGSAMPAITIPTRSGYDFVGYFAETAGAGTQYYNGSGASAHVWNVPSPTTLYAHWQPATYSITYVNMEGGDNSENPTFYSRVTSNVTLKNPTKPGCYFGGWFTNAELTSPASTPAINASTDTGNKTFYAKWTLAAAMVTAGNVTTNYNTVADAITAANGATNAVVTILQDATITSEITITAAMTIDLNGKTIKSTQAAAAGVFKINASGKTVTITDSGTGGKIDHTASYSGSDYMYGLNLVAGTLNIDGGTIYAKNTANNRAYGIYNTGATTLNVSGGTIEATSPNYPFGLYDNSSCALTMTGGTFIASGSSSRGIYVKGTTNLTNATISVTGSSSYTIFAVSGNMTINSGTYTTSGGSDNLCIFHRNNAITINGGYFSTPSKLYKRDTNGTYTGTITLQGGYYSNDTELEAKCASNYHVLALTEAEKAEIGGDYIYKVAEAYKVTFNNYDGTQLQSDYVEKETDPAYTGATPTKAADAQYTYAFSGWDPEIVTVTGNVIYTAQFNSTVNTYTITWKNEDGSKIDETTVAYGVVPTHADAEKEPDAQYDYIFTGWTPEVTTVTTDAVYTATFSEQPRPYTITWRNYNGEELTSTTSYWDETPAYPTHLGTPTRTDEQNHKYHFIGWSPEVHEVNSEENVYTAQYELIENLVVENNEAEPERIEENTTITTTTVRATGALYIESAITLSTDDLILEATPSSSGEITGSGTVNVTSNAYFHFSREGGFKAKTWYAVAVPWQVNVPANELGDVYTKVGEGEFVQQTLGRTFDLIYYDGARRATGATKAWNYVEDDNALEQVMYPGRAYMIYLTADADMIRFRKNNEKLLYTNVDVALYASSVSGDYANWNGIANPAIYMAYLNVGATEDQAQVYNPDTKQYEMFDMSANQLQVGQPIFVQSKVEGTVVANANTYNPSLAPRRTNGESTQLTRYEVVFANSEGEASDRIIVRMDEDKEEDEYIVGEDLAKMGVSAVVPQMWIDRYDSRLCINTAIPANNKATYPLSLFAPQAGEYTIVNGQIVNDQMVNDQMVNDAMLYLTYDGRVIWNLSYASYTASFEKGTDSHYGLMVVRSYVPAVTTDIEQSAFSDQPSVQKVMIDDKVYILRGGEIYTITGQKVQ